MITKNFCFDVALRLNTLNLPQDKVPTPIDLYKACLKLLFRSKDIYKIVNVFTSYSFLINHYTKVVDAMNSKKWTIHDLYDSLNMNVSPKGKIHTDIAYVTNFFGSTSFIEYEDELKIHSINSFKSTIKYELVYDNGVYHVYELKKHLAKFQAIRDNDIYAVVVFLDKGASINPFDILREYLEMVKKTKTMESIFAINTLRLMGF